MPGPAPKHASARQRRNKASTASTLRPDPNIEAPELPAGDWHEATVAWWRDIWASPMGPEFDDSDRHGLYMLAALVDAFWSAESPALRSGLAAEIRLQSQRFGLSPLDRRRLQWEIERTEEAQDRGRQRRSRNEEAKQPAADPRAVLRAV